MRDDELQNIIDQFNSEPPPKEPDPETEYEKLLARIEAAIDQNEAESDYQMTIMAVVAAGFTLRTLYPDVRKVLSEEQLRALAEFSGWLESIGITSKAEALAFVAAAQQSGMIVKAMMEDSCDCDECAERRKQDKWKQAPNDDDEPTPHKG